MGTKTSIYCSCICPSVRVMLFKRRGEDKDVYRSVEKHLRSKKKDTENCSLIYLLYVSG